MTKTPTTNQKPRSIWSMLRPFSSWRRNHPPKYPAGILLILLALGLMGGLRSTQFLSAFYRPAAIGGLLGNGGPSAVVGLVIAVVIDPVDRMTVWAPPHISEEILIAHQPAVTDPDPPAAVVLIGPNARVIATRFQAAPDAVLALGMVTGSGPSSASMAEASRGGALAAKASTTAAQATAKARTDDCDGAAAIALTQPSELIPETRRLRSAGQDGQPAEALAD